MVVSEEVNANRHRVQLENANLSFSEGFEARTCIVRAKLHGPRHMANKKPSRYTRARQLLLGRLEKSEVRSVRVSLPLAVGLGQNNPMEIHMIERLKRTALRLLQHSAFLFSTFVGHVHPRWLSMRPLGRAL